MRSAVQRRHTMRSAGALCSTELVTADTAYIMRILLLTLRLLSSRIFTSEHANQALQKGGEPLFGGWRLGRHHSLPLFDVWKWDV